MPRIERTRVFDTRANKGGPGSPGLLAIALGREARALLRQALEHLAVLVHPLT